MTADEKPKHAAPRSLRAGGRALWDDIAGSHDLDESQRVQLLEACRAKDRLDQLDSLLCGDVHTWSTIAVPSSGDSLVLKIDAALVQANATANLLKQLLAALRLPDAVSGKRPAARGARGAYKPRAGTVSSLARAREAKSGG